MKKFQDNKLFISIIILLFIFNISLVFILQNAWMSNVSRFLPIMQHTQNLKYELASGRLYLAEYFLQPEDIDIEIEIFQRHQRVAVVKKKINKIITDMSFSSLFLEKFKNIEKEISNLKKLANLRIESSVNEKSNKEPAILFHSQYTKTQKLLLDFEQDMINYLEEKKESRHFYFTVAIALFVFFNASMFFILYNIRKKSLNYNAELLEQKKAFESLFQDSKDGIMLLKNALFYDCNTSALKMFGVTKKEELLNAHPSDISPVFQPDGKDSYVKVMQMISLALQNGSHSFQWLHKRLNGETFMTEIMLTHLKLNHEDIMHVSIRDISERMQREKEYNENQKILFQQSKMAQMGSMLSSIAHQWKQPLSKINAKLLKLSSSLGLEQDKQDILDKHIEDIETVTSYLGNTIENFRTYFNPSQEKILCNLYEVIEKAYILSSLSDNKNSIKFSIECSNDLEYYGYEDALIQVLIILINNAEEAHQHKNVIDPFVTIKVHDYALNIEISVIDNGEGICEEIKDNIFNPYFSTKKTKENSGIGLSIAKTIIENSMHGLLSYKIVNNNTCFNIIINDFK